MAKQGLEQERGLRPDEELEGLKSRLRERARAIEERERELERERRKLGQRERRLGRRLRLHRAERNLFTPVQRKLAERTDEGAKLERAAAALAGREQKLAAREAEVDRLAAELDTRERARAIGAELRSSRPSSRPGSARPRSCPRTSSAEARISPAASVRRPKGADGWSRTARRSPSARPRSSGYGPR